MFSFKISEIIFIWAKISKKFWIKIFFIVFLITHWAPFTLMSCPNGLACAKCLNPAKNSCDISGWSLLEYVIFCHILWWVFYYVLLLLTRQSAEWCCRFVTLIHGCLISYAAITDICWKDPYITFCNGTLSEAQKIYLSHMLSYFCFDFCWMHLFGDETWIIYVHHFTSIVIITSVLIKSCGGNGISYGVAGLEFSNPYLQLRWFLRTHGYLNKPIHTITELWFVFVFFMIRMVGGSMLLYRCILSKSNDYGMKLCCLTIYGVSLLLQWQICGFIKKKYFTAEGRRGLALRTRDSMSPYFQRRTSDEIDDVPTFGTDEDTTETSSSVKPLAEDTVQREVKQESTPKATRSRTADLHSDPLHEGSKSATDHHIHESPSKTGKHITKELEPSKSVTDKDAPREPHESPSKTGKRGKAELERTKSATEKADMNRDASPQESSSKGAKHVTVESESGKPGTDKPDAPRDGTGGESSSKTIKHVTVESVLVKYDITKSITNIVLCEDMPQEPSSKGINQYTIQPVIVEYGSSRSTAVTTLLQDGKQGSSKDSKRGPPEPCLAENAPNKPSTNNSPKGQRPSSKTGKRTGAGAAGPADISPSDTGRKSASKSGKRAPTEPLAIRDGANKSSTYTVFRDSVGQRSASKTGKRAPVEPVKVEEDINSSSMDAAFRGKVAQRSSSKTRKNIPPDPLMTEDGAFKSSTAAGFRAGPGQKSFSKSGKRVTLEPSVVKYAGNRSPSDTSVTYDGGRKPSSKTGKRIPADSFMADKSSTDAVYRGGAAQKSFSKTNKRVTLEPFVVEYAGGRASDSSLNSGTGQKSSSKVGKHVTLDCVEVDDEANASQSDTSFSDDIAHRSPPKTGKHVTLDCVELDDECKRSQSDTSFSEDISQSSPPKSGKHVTLDCVELDNAVSRSSSRSSFKDYNTGQKSSTKNNKHVTLDCVEMEDEAKRTPSDTSSFQFPTTAKRPTSKDSKRAVAGSLAAGSDSRKYLMDTSVSDATAKKSASRSSKRIEPNLFESSVKKHLRDTFDLAAQRSSPKSGKHVTLDCVDEATRTPSQTSGFQNFAQKPSSRSGKRDFKEPGLAESDSKKYLMDTSASGTIAQRPFSKGGKHVSVDTGLFDSDTTFFPPGTSASDITYKPKKSQISTSLRESVMQRPPSKIGKRVSVEPSLAEKESSQKYPMDGSPNDATVQKPSLKRANVVAEDCVFVEYSPPCDQNSGKPYVVRTVRSSHAEQLLTFGQCPPKADKAKPAAPGESLRDIKQPSSAKVMNPSRTSREGLSSIEPSSVESLTVGSTSVDSGGSRTSADDAQISQSSVESVVMSPSSVECGGMSQSSVESVATERSTAGSVDTDRSSAGSCASEGSSEESEASDSCSEESEATEVCSEESATVEPSSEESVATVAKEPLSMESTSAVVEEPPSEESGAAMAREPTGAESAARRSIIRVPCEKVSFVKKCSVRYFHRVRAEFKESEICEPAHIYIPLKTLKIPLKRVRREKKDENQEGENQEPKEE